MQSYFMGLLRTKMSELQAEIGKISREVEAANEEQSTFLAYDKRVKELAAELTGKRWKSHYRVTHHLDSYIICCNQ